MSQTKYKRTTRKRQHKNSSFLPILLALGGLLLVGLAAFSLLRGKSTSSNSAPQVAGSPRLIADPERVDLGDVRLGTPVRVVFTLTNIGDQPLGFTEAPYIEVKEGC